MIIPPTTAIPIDTLLSDPAPNANAIGRIPRIVDKLVIKIGLNHILAAPCMDSKMEKPCSFR